MDDKTWEYFHVTPYAGVTCPLAYGRWVFLILICYGDTSDDIPSPRIIIIVNKNIVFIDFLGIKACLTYFD